MLVFLRSGFHSAIGLRIMCLGFLKVKTRAPIKHLYPTKNQPKY